MTNNIKIAFKNVIPAQKSQFANSVCLLTISVGQESHEGEFFNLTIDLINKSFKSCIILVDDSLQRYTMALNSDKSPSYYYELAVLEGRNWLRRNKQYYNKLTIPYKILHWDQWLKHDNFKQQKNIIKESIKNDPAYKATFDKVAENFVSKSRKRTNINDIFNISRAKRLSMAYIIEECAALCLWTSLNCQFEVYPGLRNEAMSATHKKFVLPQYPDLLHPVAIRFRHADQFKPQTFNSVNNIDYLTKEKEYLEILESIIAMMPGHVYWLDTKGVYLGCNDNQANSAGLKSRKDIIGLRNKDLPWNQGADQLVKELDRANWEVMSGNPVSLEEPGILSNGKQAMFLSNKVPLYNSNREIIGLVGISIDITAQKEAEQHKIKTLEAENKLKQILLESEHLKFENEVHKATAKTQKKFKKEVDQMVHDIGTPIATINMLISSCPQMPEEIRIGVREALSRINGITGEILDQYNNKNSCGTNKKEIARPLVLSSTLMQSINEKKYQYRDRGIKFSYDFPKEGNFVFIKMQANAFKRAISNIINNSVDALDKESGMVTLKLDISEAEVKIIIEDNGRGMPPEVRDKIINAIEVTSEKENGHGIGMCQVRDTLNNNSGKLEIKSRIGLGTKIFLTFPRLEAPNWIAQEITLYESDTVIILDDDNSIHGAWEKRFKADAPDIKLRHFTQGKEVIKFIHNLTEEEKQKIFLLTDYELINQELDGLKIINQTGIKRSILVTSHHENEEVHKLANKTKTKILPKQLAAEVSILVKKAAQPKNIRRPIKNVDLVIVDDEQYFGEYLVSALSQNKIVDYYSNVHDLLDHINQYPLNTKFSLDNQLPFMDGIDLARKLYNMGYTNLYMLSGEQLDDKIVPPYLTVILKNDLEFLEKLKSFIKMEN
jgi:signal transduction histidine kinase/FixJ family two-component response regulator